MVEVLQRPKADARKGTRVLSTAVRDSADRRRKSEAVVLKGISPGRLITIEPHQFGWLDVDPTYQRGETTMVGEIIRVIQAGGKILDPITVCRRPWSDDLKKLWIVDGYQRTCAMQQLKVPILAMVHDSESIDDEKVFFLTLNTRKAIAPDVVAKGWVGPAGDLLRRVSTESVHPLCGRINFAQSGGRGKIGARSLTNAAYTAGTGSILAGSPTKIMGYLDFALRDRMNRARIEHYLNLIGYVFPNSSASLPILRAYALVAHPRWKIDIALPKRSVLDRLAAINWKNEVPVIVEKFRPMYLEHIQRIWKE